MLIYCQRSAKTQSVFSIWIKWFGMDFNEDEERVLISMIGFNFEKRHMEQGKRCQKIQSFIFAHPYGGYWIS